MADLTTLQAARSWLGLTSDDDDVNLQRSISAASSQIEAFCGRALAQTTHTERYSGNGNAVLTLRQYPIVSVSSLAIGGYAVPASPDARQSGYLITPPRRLSLVGRRFSRGVENVLVTYTAGYAVIPADLELACLEWLKVGYLARTRDPAQGAVMEEAAGGSRRVYGGSSNGGSSTEGLANTPMPAKVLALLNPYRNVVPA